MCRLFFVAWLASILCITAFAIDSNPSASEPPSFIYINGSCLAFYARNIEMIVEENPPKTYLYESIDSNNVVCGQGNKASLSFTAKGKSDSAPSVIFSFEFLSNDLGYWTLDKSTAELDGNAHDLSMKWSEIPSTMGYKCSYIDHVLASNTKPIVKFNFHGLQVQPFGITDGVFTDASDCIGFMSPEIFSTLFIVFLLLGIFAYGYVMLMGIQANDTFDDVKHKMIQLGGTAE